MKTLFSIIESWNPSLIFLISMTWPVPGQLSSLLLGQITDNDEWRNFYLQFDTVHIANSDSYSSNSDNDNDNDNEN